MDNIPIPDGPVKRCPACGADGLVIDCRPKAGSNAIRRRRRCPACDMRWSTIEISIEAGAGRFRGKN